MDSKEKLTPKQKEAVREALRPLIEVVEQKSSSLYTQCESSFDQTGFTREVWESEQCCLVEGDEVPAGPWEAWDILPHQYVASKLYHVDEAIDRLNEAIEASPVPEVIKALEWLKKIAHMVFAEVEEFLDGAFSKMTKEEWERQPHWEELKRTRGMNWIFGVPMYVGPGWSLTPEVEEAVNAFYN